MGYFTDFKGAFRVTPIVSTEVALRINLWLNSRHYTRPMPQDLEDETLFGKPGKHGEFIMPSLRNALAKMQEEGLDPVVVPWAIRENYEDIIRPDYSSLSHAEQAKWTMDFNECPGKVPSLWSDFMLVSDHKNNCSWLMWNDSDKAYSMASWGEFLWKVLQAMDYLVEGTMCAQGEDDSDFWYMQASKESFAVVYETGVPTYQQESQAALERSEKIGKQKN